MSVQIKVGPPVITINQGSTFMVTDERGEIDTESEQGVFAGDTRLVSFYQLYINGAQWQLLNSSAVSYYAARLYFTNPAVASEDGDVRGQTLGLTVTRTVGDGIHEDLDISYNIVVNKHHGDIKVLSNHGKTCFQVSLPVNSDAS